MTATRVRVPQFEPRPYQIPLLAAMDKGCKRAVICWHRRGGKEITCFNHMVSEAFLGRVGTYCYFFPTSTLGRRILWDGANKDGKRFLDYIPKEVVESVNSVEMKVTLKNGSIIQVIGTDKIVNVGINPVGCVFSEYSLQDPKCWNYVRPILRENDGWAIFNFCVKKGTLVLTEKGLKRIEAVSKVTGEFTNIDTNIYGIGGFHRAEQFYSGGLKNLLRITTKKGFEIECTPNHQLWNGEQWVRADLWNVGEYLPIQLDQQVFSDTPLDISSWKKPKPKDSRGNWKSLPDYFLSIDFFYLMGLYLAEGSMDHPGPGRGGKLTITNTDPEIIDWLNKWDFKTQKDGIHHNYCGTELQSFFLWFGLGGIAKNKTIPEKLLSCPRRDIIAFLQGYFDGDGTVGKRGVGYVKATSSSRELLSVLQVLLLNFGIVSRLSKCITPPTKKVRVECTVYNLEIEGHFAYRFMDRVGFRLTRKQTRIELISSKPREGRGDIVPTDALKIGWYPMDILSNPSKIGYRVLKKLNKYRENDYIKNIISDGFYWDKIASIEKSEGEVFDFVIPDTKSFFSNGILSHNTPRGRNWAYDMYLMAKSNPDWFCEKLTIKDTGVLSEKEMDQERADGMSEHLIQQEFYCSFDQGTEGAYYAKLLNRAEMDGRITSVPFDPDTCVDTYWDLGVRDSTVILLCQNVGKSVHIINMCRAEGEGLNFYARWLQTEAEKHDYTYGTHYAPHDIRVRELGSGARSRYEIAKDLGIPFSIVPNIPILDGIELARGVFPRVWIDSEKCSYLVKSLENYHKHYNETLNVFSDKPVHDWSSNSADSFRYLSIMQNKRSRGFMSEEEANEIEKKYSFRHM